MSCISTISFFYTMHPFLFSFFFFFNDTATTEIYTLSLHDALPISILLYSDPVLPSQVLLVAPAESDLQPIEEGADLAADIANTRKAIGSRSVLVMRSEEHTSELQSPCNLVCRLLLEKKKQRRSEI